MKLIAHLEATNRRLVQLYGQPGMDIQETAANYSRKALQLAAYVSDTGSLLRQRLHSGKKLLVEGAQGTLLDIDHGTYPYVTSSTTTAPGVLTGLGLGLQFRGRVIGVMKAFQSRVGEGPFTTELQDELALRLRGSGENPWDEYGTTTGRPRRVGWLDCVLLRYAADINGITELAVTKLDILSGLPVLRICTGYRYKGSDFNELPAGLSPEAMNAYQPLYQEMPGWSQDLTAVRSWDDLPVEAQAYILKIEAVCGVPVKMISVGPEREQIIYRR
jgi:adenylosuccinate synthase